MFKKALKISVKAGMKTMKWIFIVFCVYLSSLFFRQERLPGAVAEKIIAKAVPDNFVVGVDSVSVGFRHGILMTGVKFRDIEKSDPVKPVASADIVAVDFIRRRVRIEGAYYPRLPDSYYAPGNRERNSRIEFTFPALPRFKLILVRPEILSLAPAKVEANVIFKPKRVEFGNVHVLWPREESSVKGFCYVDFDAQELYGEVEGNALQPHIRPMIDTLDVPVALAYMDRFTEVPKSVPAWCSWKVNLTNNDFDLKLYLRPTLGKYNSVPMREATGRIHLHSYTRGDCLNYKTVIGPVSATDTASRPLEGSVTVVGTNYYNVVDIKAESSMPLADIIKIAGFTGTYVSADAAGDVSGNLQFRFPRSMTNNYEVLNGHGSVELGNGKLTRLKIFAGLTELLANKVPGVAYIVDQSSASLDYTIENGVFKSDNIVVEGGLFSIRMRGEYDIVPDKLDFLVQIKFTRNDSLMDKFLKPITWPFAKLLLEFRLVGTIDDPRWEYVSVVDRLLEVAK